MAIITISRELAALGDETAHELENQLKYRLVDKSALEERMKSYGIAGNKLEKYDEKKPSLLASLSRDRDDYLHYLKSAILAEAGQGNTVFVGRGAALILKDVPGVFSVFLAAPWEIRIERVKGNFHCDEKRAVQVLEKSDHDREGFHRYFFDVKWKAPGNYHLALNTGQMRPELCAGIVKYMLDRIMTGEVETENVMRIQELTLGQRIRHKILYEKKVPIHFLEVTVTGGEPRPAGAENRIFLYGVANAQSLIETAVSSARELAPGYTVQSEIQVVQEYSFMP